MPTIAFISPKGGVGKTTASLLLACELAERKLTTTLIDADPNRPIAAWSKLPGVPPALSVIAHDDKREDTTIVDEIDQAASKTAFVIIDLEGTANLIVAHAISRADLVIIPMQGKHLDAREATKAAAMVAAQGRVVRRKIPAVILLSRTSPTIRTMELRDIPKQITAAGLDILSVELMERAAFSTIFSYGGTLSTLKPDEVNGLEAARGNARAFAQQIITMMMPNRTVVERRPVVRTAP
jgi:chromosome partitioning protein